MCALDLMTRRKVKQLKKNGKASRTEMLLMTQMLTCSFVNIFNTIIYTLVFIVLNLFFGPSTLAIFTSMRIIISKFLFSFFVSTISVFTLRKPKEQRVQQRTGKSITVKSCE
ncbi:unnamed protein product, partial [Mesorhabditis belari]|uniref:Uncharacterized protein n=1 Tax=Mesorhabditis belari TaxID=2138241 RepID=A0AAF3F7F0_9BILA